MEFICLGSSSSGNAYVFKQDNRCVLVECGFKFEEIIKKLHSNDIELADIEAVITTHSHSDHSKAVGDFRKIVPTFTPFELMEYHVIDDPVYDLGFLLAYCFPVKHDVTACGFMFLNKITNESILFINDTKCFDLPKDLTKMSYDYIFIECNHLRNQLEVVMQQALDNHDAGKVYKYKRQSAYHMSLAATKKMLKTLNLKNTKAIFLMHLSKEVSNDVVMKAEIEKLTGKKVFVCMRNGGLL